MKLILILLCITGYIWLSHFISYSFLKKRILKQKKWDLNICCGKSDVGRINADIVKHKNDLSNFQLIENINKLPFKDKQFDNVLCSHTIEHVYDPMRFFRELNRIGKNVTVVIPPLYDISAVLNIFEHKHIFLSFKKKHQKLPKFIKLPLAAFTQKYIGQIING
jgi:ubiquinone/menaquinone biosynthesis C-methylase UbiE